MIINKTGYSNWQLGKALAESTLGASIAVASIGFLLFPSAEEFESLALYKLLGALLLGAGFTLCVVGACTLVTLDSGRALSPLAWKSHAWLCLIMLLSIGLSVRVPLVTGTSPPFLAVMLIPALLVFAFYFGLAWREKNSAADLVLGSATQWRKLLLTTTFTVATGTAHAASFPSIYLMRFTVYWDQDPLNVLYSAFDERKDLNSVGYVFFEGDDDRLEKSLEMTLVDEHFPEIADGQTRVQFEPLFDAFEILPVSRISREPLSIALPLDSFFKFDRQFWASLRKKSADMAGPVCSNSLLEKEDFDCIVELGDDWLLYYFASKL